MQSHAQLKDKHTFTNSFIHNAITPKYDNRHTFRAPLHLSTQYTSHSICMEVSASQKPKIDLPPRRLRFACVTRGQYGMAPH